MNIYPEMKKGANRAHEILATEALSTADVVGMISHLWPYLVVLTSRRWSVSSKATVTS